ncbi:nuclear transport factor 2 family protein [bacterium]|nr:nuclear transport factor 2 family protein [bacterium]
MSVETMLPVLISQLEGGRSLNIYGLMHHDAEQYENGELFGSGRKALLQLHREFREGVKGYRGVVLDSRIEGDIAYLHVRYEFTESDGQQYSIPGIHELHWQGNMVKREDFWVEKHYAKKRKQLFPG